MKNIYISLLRGINVSGQKKIKMADLKLHFEALGFSKVVTYIQSGNIVFHSNAKDKKIMEIQIIKKIKDIYGFDVPVLIKTVVDLVEVVDKNPFTTSKYHGDQQIYITFLGEHPSTEGLQKLDEVSYPNEEYHVDGKTIYFFCSTGYGRAKMNNNFFENKLKVSATTRNWKTVNKLIELGLQD